MGWNFFEEGVKRYFYQVVSMHLKTTVIISLVILSSCAIRIGYTEVKQDIITKEKELGSTDITPDYHISIGEGIYPNVNKYKLNTPLTYLRQSDSILEHRIEYFTQKHNDKLKVILEEWTTVRIEDTTTFVSFIPQYSTKEIESVYDSLVTNYNNLMGHPHIVEIDSVRSEDYRDSYTWKSNDGLTVYLFELGNMSNGYRQVRIASYYN